MAFYMILRGHQWYDKPKADLDKYLITLHFVQSWCGIKWHKPNKLNNRDGIWKIQSKVSLKCMLPWGCQVQMTGEEGDMTAQSPPSPTLRQTHTHTHTTTTENDCSVFPPTLDASGHSCGNVQQEQGRRESEAKRGKNERENWGLHGN